MKILAAATWFYPTHGGIQTVARLFAQAMVEMGHEVRVVTTEKSEVPDDLPFQVVRSPSWWELVRQFRWADVVILHGPSVTLGWPALFLSKPVAVIHYMAEPAGEHRKIIKEFARRALYRRCRHISVSQGFRPTIPAHYPYSAALMPIDTDLFRIMPGVERDRDLFFIGRLHKFKGVYDLIDAVIALNASGKRYTVTMVGGGPEHENLARRIREEGLTGQVELTGRMDGDEVVRLMNRHKLVIVPSQYEEPFGLVAVEGIACGCVAVGTSGGGLPGAIGPCGVTYPNSDVAALTRAIVELLETPGGMDCYRQAAPGHVALHTPRAAAERLLALIVDGSQR